MMKKGILGLILGLAACSVPQENARIALDPADGMDAAVMEAPVMAAPIMMPNCSQDDAIARDGIGGTGCR